MGGATHLQGRPSEDELPPCPHITELIEHTRVAVLEAVALVDDHVRPLDASERLGVSDDHLKGGEDGVEAVAVP